jgi:hypothetical protein
LGRNLATHVAHLEAKVEKERIGVTRLTSPLSPDSAKRALDSKEFSENLSSLRVEEVDRDPAHEIIERATQRDPVAFASLYEHGMTKIYRYIYYQVSHRQEAEDLTAQVFSRPGKPLPITGSASALFLRGCIGSPTI